MANTASSQNAAVLIKRALNAYNSSNFDQAVEHSRAALIILEGLEDSESHILIDEAFERLAMAYQRIGDFAASSEVITEWQTRTQRPEGHVLARIQQARVAHYTGNYAEAKKLIEQATELAQAAGYPFGVGMAKRILADLMWKQGNTEDAMRLGQEALAVMEQAGEIEQQAAAHVTIAAAAHSSGQFYKAIQHLQRAARIVDQLGRQFEMAIILSNLGETYAELYAMDKALEAHQSAIELVGIERAHPDLIRNLGVDQIAVGKEEEGQSNLNLALERAEARHDPDMVAQVLYSLAQVDLSAGRLDEATKRADRILEIAEQGDSLRHRIRAWMVQGEAAQKKGDQAQAQMLFHECSMAAQRAADRHAIWRTHAALHDLSRETMPQMAEIHRRIAAEMMTNILNTIEDPELHETFRRAEPVQSVLGTEV
ncbi:MAG: tetratricopeptide repeat protein [Chloroflexi bacterium]|nr:tetratricopeptide repeat protein [Chloroflexota bacterium]